ncbi:hypothetical protein E2C01_049654 [Portunus trituberculatus]|uniref:Uncharacterized protein n=1 Tax=Portunus trituberculatus TaxID=210409 RepID=A0A5B7G6Z3_PORTR|nr:hypothetical protein [Portunus trituberculatus]
MEILPGQVTAARGYQVGRGSFWQPIFLSCSVFVWRREMGFLKGWRHNWNRHSGRLSPSEQDEKVVSKCASANIPNPETRPLREGTEQPGDKGSKNRYQVGKDWDEGHNPRPPPRPAGGRSVAADPF